MSIASQPASSSTRLMVVCFTLLCLAVCLTAYSSRNPQIARFGSWVVGTVTGPIQRIVTASLSSVDIVIDRYVALVDVRDQNAELVHRLASLERENAELVEFRVQNERLRSLLALREEVADAGLTASVVGYEPSGWSRGIVIDKGSREGVRVGMPIVVGVGVVGQVVSTEISTSRVLLLTDSSSGADVLIQSSRTRGVIEGSGRESCQLLFVRTEEPVKKGDRIITSGMDGVYPKGLLIGHISEIRPGASSIFHGIDVAPAVDFERLEEVFIITSARERPSDDWIVAVRRFRLEGF
jgi:rod shape-determining protein MreC